MIELNKALFKSRLARIYDCWLSAKNDEEFAAIADTDAWLLVAGDPAPEDEAPKKGTCFQIWLLGFEFPATMMLFERERVTFFCSASKAKYLSQIQDCGGPITIDILAQAKGKDAPNDALQGLMERYTAHTRIGTLVKESQTGKTTTDWAKLLESAQSKPEKTDITTGISAILAIKDEEELAATSVSAKLTSTLFKNFVVTKLETILDREAKVSHQQLATQIETRLGSGEGEKAKGPDVKIWAANKALANVDWQSVEFVYTPIVVTRSTKHGYDIRYTIESSDDPIAHKGVVLISLGMKYKNYCANISRTLIVGPTTQQESQYQMLHDLQKELLGVAKAGATCRSVYQHALTYVREKKPDLEAHFVKTVGFGTGTEFRDSNYVLSPKSTRVLKADMIFILNLGLTELKAQDGSQYALHLADTIRIQEKGSVLLSEGIKSVKDQMFYENEGEDEEKPAKKLPTIPRANGSPNKKTVGGKVLRNANRSTQDEAHQTAAAKMIEHQKDLHSQLNERGVERYSEAGDPSATKEGKTWRKFNSYRGEAALPPEAEKQRIFVDRKAQTVVLPVHGFAVPFHINTVKNASKNDEGDYTYLRINFQTPGQLAGKKEDTPFESPDATFIRSVTFRSLDGHRFDTIHKQITELKRDANKREQQRKELADVVEQDNLVELKGRRPAKLSEVFARPALDGKRLPGELEIHQNGIRYQSVGTHKIDVLFSNVKHLFFQPCDHELLVIIHIHLRAPIMIGKKKSSDIQFFREASDVQFDETGNRKRKHRYGDEDEIEMEHQERKRRHMLNKEFKAFAEKIAEAGASSTGDNLELDIPFRELSFEGVPHRTSARLQPTTDCLVHLTEPPFSVVTLGEIELASLERVQYGLKQFDMVLVFTDYTRMPLHINSIQSTQLDDVKNWLDSVDIPITESQVNLNWGPIMKTINEDPHGFFQNGGWSFLAGEGDASEESDSESEFEAGSEAFAEDSSSDSGSDFSEGGDSSDASDDYDDDGSSDEGDDWDALEKKAAQSDKKHRDGGPKDSDDDSDDNRRGKKAPAKKSKSNGKPAVKTRR
ncbi:FACT complex subunit SPT16 [Pterulicium gracile]|uniref:FACT complex subunit n=1 Tax=Pterulicium gracile TaxID=1884261 RepID=A0A5C3QZG5_9AGAR|nr:FACT complex subunit SPT16 [Pterula gracilis]